jgi:hypothetical protein
LPEYRGKPKDVGVRVAVRQPLGDQLADQARKQDEQQRTSEP